MKTYPLLQSQLGIFLECMSNPDMTKYNLPTVAPFSKKVSPDRLAAALHRIIETIPEIKTHFLIDDEGTPRQYSDASMEVPVTRRKMTEEEAKDYIDNHFVRPYDVLGGEPLWRFEVIESEAHNYVLLECHHSVGDGLSLSPNMTNNLVPKAYSGDELVTTDYGMYQYAEDEQAGFATEAYQRAKEYYAEKFAGVDFTSLANNTSSPWGNSIRESAYIDQQAVDDWCKAQGTTPNLLFMAAFSYVLSQLSREEKVAYYTLNHGRMDKRLMTALGMFVKSTPVLADASPTQNVMDFIKSFRRELMSTIRYGIYPFSHFCTDLHMSPAVSFSFQGFSMQETVTVGGEEVKVKQLPKYRSDSDLTCLIYFTEGKYDIRLDASDALYSREKLRQIADSVLAATVNMMAHPEATLADIVIVTEEQKAELMRISAGKHLDVDVTKTFVESFVERAAQCPDAPAVVDVDSQFTYSQLDRYSNVLSHILIANGVKPNSFVCVMLDRRKEFPLSVIAIHKAGAAYTPLDFEYPNERLSYMIQDSQSSVLITTHAVLAAKQAEGGLETGDARLIYIDDIDFADSKLNAEPVNHTTPDNLAYMIYTSGSTGRPKGAMLHQAGLWNFINVVIDMEKLTADDRIEGHRSFSFDAHIEDLYAILTLGGSFHIMPSEIRKDLQAMHDFIIGHRITGGGYSTAIGALLLNTFDDLPVRFITAGGEKLDGVYSDHIEIINVYGPTECTDDTSYYSIRPGEHVENIPIGKPVANTWNFIVDSNGHLVPPGMVGELCIAGIQVGRGYWQLPERTAQSFVDCPFVSEDRWGRKVRMYHTGDLCRWNAQGDLEYMGRIDFQVKLRGFRIELGEIENKVLQMEGILQAAAEVKKVMGAERLILYYTVTDGSTLDDEAIRQALEASSLADYMVPDTYMRLDVMPITPNGKINRKILPEPVIREEYVAPETAEEEQVLALVSDVLKTEGMGVTSNLIAYGLTSLSAMRLSARIKSQLGVTISVGELLSSPTIRAIAAATGQKDDAAAPTATGATRREMYPISENQRGVYIDWEMHREAIQYNIPKVLKIKSVDATRLRDALIQVINAHPYIKTHFIQKDGDVMQLQLDGDEPVVTVETIDFEPDHEFFQKRVRPFDLFRDRLYRFEIYQTPTQVYLFQDAHHSVFDGISGLVIMNDIQRVLNGETLSVETFSAFDQAVEEAELLAGKAGEEAERYFDGLLGQCESTVYPHSSEGTGDSGFGTYEFTIPSEKIDEFCRKAGVTSNAYFATILSQLLHRVTREDSVLFSTIDNGRTRTEKMQSVGMYVKTLPVTSVLNLQAAMTTSVEKAVKDMHRQLMDTLSYSYYPFTRMSERHHLRPQILYVYHGYLASEAANDQVEEVMLNLDTVKMPLTVTVYHKGGSEYTVLLSYNPALYASYDMQKLASAFRAASLHSLSIGHLGEFSMLDDRERRLVDSFRYTSRKDIPWKLFYQPIEENAVRYAGRVALIAKDRTLTFAEFNTEANRIAHALLRKGVKRGDRVVLLLPRRSAVIVSMFGVSKTGAAYIPCDPEYPADRINLIMTDSEAQFIITTPEHSADYPSEKVILIDDIYQNGQSQPGDDENPQVNVSPDDLAYLIYTSGSTGRPKGVMLRHVGIANYLYDDPANVHIHGLTELGVKSFVSITTLSFDMSLKEFAGSLFNGITSILADEQEVMDAQLLAALMKRTGAEAINGTCSRILTYMELADFREALAHCKAVWSGGEKYPLQLLTQLQALGVHVFNTYGPTEITVSSNIADLTKARKVTVGRPLLNYEEFIVDQFDQQLPAGFVGELLIGGPGVALGYNNLPAMTAERFVFYQDLRVYRSGDLARWLPDGDVEILGRNDGQVKLRGFRVELGEIEGVAAKYEGIRQAVADIKEVGAMQHLCLYYTAETDIDEEQLKAFMAESLTEYMVPTAYMRIDAIPLTPNGKTNRKALPAPIIRLEEIVPPANETEDMLLQVMKQQLKIDELGVTTNLVAVGLSSIVAMRLSAILLQQHELMIPVKDILEHPTVREMALYTKSEKTFQYKPYPIRESYPLSEAQRGMLVDCLVNTDALQYNIPCLLKYRTLDVARFKNALEQVGEAHPYLKARIAMQGEDYVQVRHDDDKLEIEEYVLDYDPDRAFFQSQVKPFDVLHEKLYRFQLYTTPSYYYLFIDIHHLISDGSSNYILAREMEKAYSGQPLKKESYTAFDRAIDEENIMKTERGIEAEQYFDTLIGGTEATVYPHSAEIDGNGFYGELRETIPAEAIECFCRQHALAPSSFFLTVVHHVLHRIIRDESTLVYFISNGRSEVQLENFFGVFVKTMPTVVNDYSSDIISSVRAMHQQMLDTIAHDYYPFTKMVERHGLKAEILYNYFVDLQTSMSLGGDAVESVGLDWDTAKTPLSVTMLRDDDGNFVSSLEYDSQLYSEADMLILNKAIRAFAENCIVSNVPLTKVPIMSRDQAATVKILSCGKPMAYDATQTFPALFMQRAAAAPNAPAVVDEQGTYTYSELNILSGALALRLRELGVGSAEVHSPFVSIMLGYQKEFVVAAIGVEKAGGAYVPLDYDYPNDRLLYMLEDSESQVLITSHRIFDEKTSGGDNFMAKNILFIEDFIAEERNDKSDLSLVNFATPDDIAYMIYTSGSTGKPKGVMIPHRAKTNFVNFIAKEWGHTDKSRICCHSSFSFDASVEDLYPVLTVGGTLYTVPQEARKDMELLHDFIVKNGITGGCYTTQLGQMLLQMYPDLPVDYLVVGGEKMTTAPNCKCRLINTYGPTEFTVDATFFDVEQGKEYKNIPIGRALHNLEAYVVDPYGQLVPQGVAGELCMAGIQMAAGYWKREDLTAEKFTDCPFAEGRMYHTGDLVKYNGNGDIEYLGRIDSQVKLRGFRIELGEIETLIASYEDIQMVSVQVKEIGGVQHLCAYYSANREIDSDALKEYLSSQLTDYMVPTAYMQMAEMPLTPNGKVNTKALPVPEVKAEAIVAPETETEKKLFDIAVELLKHDQFGVTSNLISMGLTSLSAMRLSAILQQKLEVAIPVADLLANPSLRKIAEYIDSGKAKSTKKAAVFTKRDKPAATDAPEAPKANPFAPKNSNPFEKKKSNPFNKK